MVLDFSAPNSLGQLDCTFTDPAPKALYYPHVETQVKVQGVLAVAQEDRPDAIDRLDSRIRALMRAVTTA